MTHSCFYRTYAIRFLPICILLKQNRRGRLNINIANKRRDIIFAMSLSKEIIECARCSQYLTSQSYECSHCLIPFCYQCLIKHHHHDVKNEFREFIDQIDEILAKFLNYAHSQTEWTNHLTEDRNRLEIYIRHIEASYTQYPILTLPNFQWVNHLRNLICKYHFSIFEDCCMLMYPSLNSSIPS